VEFETYFSEEEIIKVLCYIRLNAARKRHKRHLLYNISQNRKVKPKDLDALEDKDFEDLKALYSIMPPRRLWRRKRIKNRKYQSSFVVDKIALQRLINGRHKSDTIKGDWVDKLDKFILDVQKKALQGENYIFETPKVFPVKKNQYKKDKDEYRAIVKYPSLIDQIVDKLCARYLREALDSSFLDCSFAFRGRNKANHIPNQHDAVQELINFRISHDRGQLYVAECDIQKFFDCVNHEIAISCLDEAAKRIGLSIDPRARNIFLAFLNSYSFQGTVRSQSYLNDRIPWCDDLRHLYSNLEQEKVGIPQGGAISCLIVNLILDSADRSVINESNQESLLYIRYCDDIIIVHESYKACYDAFKRYETALGELKLVPHPPKTAENYNKKFWENKSKTSVFMVTP
jgi:hypothetical protein